MRNCASCCFRGKLLLITHDVASGSRVNTMAKDFPAKFMTTTCEITVTVKRLVLQNLMLYITSKIPSAEFNPFRESDKYLQSVAISKDLNIYNIFNTKDYLRERKREIKFIFYLIEKKLKYELQKIFNFVFNL